MSGYGPRLRATGGRSGTGRSSAQAGVPLERQLDEALDQLGIAQPRLLPEQREHRGGGETGHRLDLVDHDAGAVEAEEVHPGEALDVEGLEGPDRQRAHLGGDVLVERGRDPVALLEVLRLEVV